MFVNRPWINMSCVIYYYRGNRYVTADFIRYRKEVGNHGNILTLLMMKYMALYRYTGSGYCFECLLPIQIYTKYIDQTGRENDVYKSSLYILNVGMFNKNSIFVCLLFLASFVCSLLLLYHKYTRTNMPQ